ncbi:MAG: signal peptidase I [Burkholderiaceae bacterium]
MIKNQWRSNKGFVLFIGLMFVFRSAVADWNLVPSSSMNPTLISGDRVVVNKLAYSLRVPFTLQQVARWASPARGDVITFDSPKDEVNLIKRVIAVGGDVVAMHDNTLTINGQVIERQLVDAARVIPTESGALSAQIWNEHIGDRQIEVARIVAFNRSSAFEPVQVPAGHVLVLGDSRDNSNDSRFIGFIDVQRVTGQAVRVALSHNPDQLYIPRADRWWLAL